ncbi:MAG: hypothetical protein LBD98_02460 [Endomicrobium sp.]|jgi:hypothetical protein|nr:hypothetical protein [Endomicrobium sp.]
MRSADGKLRDTMVADIQTLFRIVQMDRIAKKPRVDIELETWKSVITGKNFLKEDNVKSLKLRNKRK